MTKYIISLEESIRHDIFRLNVKKKERQYIEGLYNDLIESLDENKEQIPVEEYIANKFYSLVNEYQLDASEYNTLWSTFKKYIDTMREYQKVDVGLEIDRKKKLDKIKDYKLDEFEIEESFYIPLEFDNNVLLGRQSELYKRRQLTRQFIIDWDSHTEIEKEKIIQKFKFTQEELNQINKIRNNINETLIK